jgi:integrase
MAHTQKIIYTSTKTGKKSVTWQARYTAPDGRERTKRFPRKVDAEKWLNVNAADVAKDQWLDPTASRLGFREWSEEWKKTTVDLRPSTRTRDLDYLARYILPTFGDRTLGQIDHMAVQEWVASLTQSGPIPWWDATIQPRRLRKPISAATAVKAAQLLGKIMAAAVRSGRIRANPCTGVKLPRVEHKEMRFLNPMEVGALAEAISPRYRALVLVAAYGGLRIGELAGLRRKRVDISRGRVDVAEIVVEVGGVLTYGQPKTRAGRRSVSLPQTVVKALNDHMSEFTADDPDAFVFTAPEGGPLRVPAWRQRFWKPAAEKAGVAPLRPHDLRHTAVALWIATGANPLEVSRRAGHTSASFTQDRYGHLFPEADCAVADRLDALIIATQTDRLTASIADTGSNSDGRNTDEVSKSGADVIPLIAPDQGTNGWTLRDTIRTAFQSSLAHSSV